MERGRGKGAVSFSHGINATVNKDEAQARADRIHAFQSELAVLRREGVLSLSDAAQDAVQPYHSGLLRRYAAEFDVDTSLDQKQLSWGMRLASLFGALALSAAVFFFFYRFWGGFATPLQVGLLVAAPLLTTLAVEFAARRWSNVSATSPNCGRKWRPARRRWSRSGSRSGRWGA